MTITDLTGLNAPSGAGCSLTLLLGGAWLQRFQGLDRHRPVEALPEVARTGPFLPPFVGMTPLATDGPGSGSGAGFGRDHAEKWQSGGVSRTTLMVTNITSSTSLNPLSTRTCTPSPDPPGAGPVVEREHRAADLHPSRTGDASSRIRPARGRSPTPSRTGHKTETDHVIRLLSTAPEQTLIVNPLIRGRSDVRRSLSAYDSRVASRIPSCAALSPAPTNKIVARAPHPHQYTQETPRSPQLNRVPFTPYVIASLLRELATDARSREKQVPFSRRISTVLASVARPGQLACGRPPPDSRQDPRPPS